MDYRTNHIILSGQTLLKKDVQDVVPSGQE